MQSALASELAEQGIDLAKLDDVEARRRSRAG
jgi:hypothetical protein